MPIQTLTSFIGVHCSLHLAVYHWWLFPNTISKIVRKGLHPKKVRKSSALSFSSSLQPAASNQVPSSIDYHSFRWVGYPVSLFIIEPGSQLYGTFAPWCEWLDLNQRKTSRLSGERSKPTELHSHITLTKDSMPQQECR